MMVPPGMINLDIELTNRCNAKCYFCPRDQTPHQGLMSEATFERTLERAIEFRDTVANLVGRELKISLCGLGESLINPRTVDCVGRIRSAGFSCNLASNGALLTEAKGRELLDAGLTEIDINIGEEGDDYEEIYKLPFEKTRDNVVRFAEMAKGRCDVRIILVNHRRSPEHLEHMKSYWRERGLDEFFEFPIMNRGGALFVDEMQYAGLPQLAEAKAMLDEQGGAPLCYAPFIFLFVGYDGKYYLCCSDWKKEAAFGTVFETSFEAVMKPKLESVRSREPVCKTCNHDPLNSLTDRLRARDDGQIDEKRVQAHLDEIMHDTLTVEEMLEQVAPGMVSAPSPSVGIVGRRIPVTGA